MPDDEDEQVPAGDLGIVADLGMPASDLGALLDDFDLYPDEILGEVAAQGGFGRSSTTWSGSPSALRPHDPGTRPMRAALEEARLAPGTADVPIGAVVLDARGAVIGVGATSARRDGDPTAPRGGGGPA